MQEMVELLAGFAFLTVIVGIVVAAGLGNPPFEEYGDLSEGR